MKQRVKMSLKLLVLLISILLLILTKKSHSKNVLQNDDPKNDYVFDDLGSGVVSEPSVEAITGSQLEIEENLVNSGLTSTELKGGSNESTDKPIVPVINELNFDNFKCSSDEQKLTKKISQLLDQFVPQSLKLRPIKRGNYMKIILDNGLLTVNKDYKVMGQPICVGMDEKTNKYDMTLSFNNLIGFYDWKIYNLFGYNFTESSIITIKQIITQLIITESIEKRTKLYDINIGKIDGLKVSVNIPEQITTTGFLKPMLEYIISRISTSIANRSMDSIVKNMKDIFYESIREKIQISP